MKKSGLFHAKLLHEWSKVEPELDAKFIQDLYLDIFDNGGIDRGKELYEWSGIRPKSKIFSRFMDGLKKYKESK